MIVNDLNIITNQKLFLDELRTRTMESHKQLESLPISASLMHDSVSIESYRIYLELMLDMWDSTEKHVFPKVCQQIADLDSRMKSETIKSDLKIIGSLIPEKRCDLFSAVPHKSTAYAMGIMYVVEGSTLGGRFIYKHINQKLGLDQTTGAGYFVGYGNQSGSKWKAFVETLVDYERANDVSEEIITGAIDAFIIIREHFAKAAPHT